ncbi:MAG: LysR family transcriptional regulator [Enterocloster sp.]
MTNSQIEGFLEIVRTGSISAASQQLFITQSGLSKKMRQLEEEMGCRLFERGKGFREIVLTKEGECFVPIARQWRRLLKDTDQVALMRKTSHLRVSAIPSINDYFMGQVYQEYMGDSEQIKLGIFSCHSAEAYMEMEKGSLDLAFITVTQYSRKLYSIPVFREPMYFLCSSGAEIQASDPSGLDGTKAVFTSWTPDYEKWFGYWFGGELNAMVRVGSVPLIRGFLETKKCWTIVPASLARSLCMSGGICMRRLVNGPPDRQVYCLREREEKDREITRFLSILHRRVKEIPGAVSFLEEMEETD